MLTTEEKAAKINAAIKKDTVRVAADNGLNRPQVEQARVQHGSLQVRIKGTWEYISSRVPFFSRTDVRLW